jgi:hypothetical protein
MLFYLKDIRQSEKSLTALLNEQGVIAALVYPARLIKATVI